MRVTPRIATAIPFVSQNALPPLEANTFERVQHDPPSVATLLH
ncbi:hypothetical protein [Sagittula stellata]|nr:hypothetical protein [Sagittula stellata]